MDKDLANEINRLIRQSGSEHMSLTETQDRVEIRFTYPKD